MNKFMLILVLCAMIIAIVSSLASCYFLYKINGSLEGNDIIKLERLAE